MHPAIDVLLKRSGWVKTAQFLTSYSQLVDENDRIHTTFKLAGTVTGRTSSGKVDEEKITGRATNLRGVNLQQVPRDEFVRGLFGAAPGYLLIEADFSQVELRIAAFLSRDPTMMRLFQTGQDIHTATASSVLGVPKSQVTKEHRKKAKPVNFGFLYSMGWRKFVIYAFENYGVHFTDEEAQAVRKAYFDQFPYLVTWHAKQRRLVHKYGRVVSPIGRIRHLPDIRSQDEMVVREAERQAINSPVQSFGSDMMLIALRIIRDRLAKAGLDAHVIGSVHDSGLFEVKREHVRQTLPIIKRGMEQDLLAFLAKVFDVHLDVPIVADLKTGSHWGDAKEVPVDAIHNPEALQVWLWANDLG
jgi:DNA polymerase-1